MKNKLFKSLTSLLLVVVMIASMLPVIPVTVNAADGTPVATFEFGANGSASHEDGKSATSYTETVGDYTLEITGGTNMYTGARDAKGNSCIKLGASSKAGSFTLTVPDDITSVVIYVAAYKAKTASIKINNGTATDLTKKSDDGKYDAINVDTTTTKTISFAVSSGYRAMVNTIEFYGASTEPEDTTAEVTQPSEPETAEPEITEPEEPSETEPTEPEEPAGYAGRYYIATIRSSGNYWYMTSNLGTGSTKRYQAVDSKLTTLPESITNPESGYVFVLELQGDGTYLIYAEGVEGNNYLGWTSGNSGALVAQASAQAFTVEETEDGLFNIHFTASDAERYLALNNNSGNDYFAWYKSGQKQNLALIPVVQTPDPDPDTPACDHADQTTTTVGASCTEAGSVTVTCNNCGAEVSKETIPTTDHNYVDDVCSVCRLPKPDSKLTIEQAITLGTSKAHNEYTADKYYITGTVVSIDNETYGNTTITDGTHTILIYGTYSADGSDRYDAMANKQEVGDVITVYGVIGQYSGTAQMRNGWIVEHTPATPEEPEDTTPEDTTPEEPSDTEATEPEEPSDTEATEPEEPSETEPTEPEEPADYSGKYYIATIRTSGNYWYMTSNLGTGSTKRYQAVDTGLTTLPESITNPESGYVFVLELQDDGTYLICVDGTENYLDWTSDNSGALVEKASAKAFTVEETEDGLFNIHFTASDAERYLALNNQSGNDYFAWYKSGQKQNLALIPVLPAAEITKVSMALDTDLSLLYGVEVNEGTIADYKMVFTLNGDTVEATSTNGTFTLRGIAPHMMGDTITATLYKGEDVVDTYEYSIKEYLEAIVNDATYGELAKDLLVYGAAAQKHMNYKPDALVTTETPNVEGVTKPESVRSTTQNDVKIDGRLSFTEVGVHFNYVNKLYIKLDNETTENVTVKVNGNVVDVVNGCVYTDAIAPKNFGTTYTFELCVDGKTYQTVEYSVNSYISAKWDNADESVSNLAKALYNYAENFN